MELCTTNQPGSLSIYRSGHSSASISMCEPWGCFLWFARHTSILCLFFFPFPKQMPITLAVMLCRDHCSTSGPIKQFLNIFSSPRALEVPQTSWLAKCISVCINCWCFWVWSTEFFASAKSFSPHLCASLLSSVTGRDGLSNDMGSGNVNQLAFLSKKNIQAYLLRKVRCLNDS